MIDKNVQTKAISCDNIFIIYPHPDRASIIQLTYEKTGRNSTTAAQQGTNAKAAQKNILKRLRRGGQLVLHGFAAGHKSYGRWLYLATPCSNLFESHDQSNLR